MKNRNFLIGLLIVAVLSGCAPKLGLRMSAPEVALEETKGSVRRKVTPGEYSGIKVKIVPLLDGRSADVFAVIDGREVLTDGDIGTAAQTGFERQLRDAGARVALLQAPTIEGEVVEWRANVSPDFPASEVVSKAKLRILVRDKKAKEIYRAVYSGEANRKHPLLDEDDVRRSLGFAMASAIEAALADDQLLGVLRASQ
jgi:Uncharacterized lipoprotein